MFCLIFDFYADPTPLGAVQVYEQKLIDIGDYWNDEDEQVRRMVIDEMEKKVVGEFISVLKRGLGR